MKLKLVMIFIGVVLILLMFGLEIVQGDDTCYTAEAGYPVCIQSDCFYTAEAGYPVYYECSGTTTYFDTGYPMDIAYPEPEASSPEIELSSITYQLEPIEPQYVNGHNLWEEIVYQFSKLLELMK